VIPVQDVSNALGSVQALFIDQCEHGAQTKQLNDFGAAACGQYLKYKSSRQRGLHGTAAALSVLARGQTDETRSLSSKILHYLNDRDEIELKVAGAGQDIGARLDADHKNVIKLAEVLYGLHFVSSAIGARDPLVKRIAEDLLGGLYEDKGWSYFLGDGEAAQILPTAYAVRALVAHGYQVDEPIASLLHELDRPSSAQTDVFVRTAGIFALTFIEPRPATVTPDKLRRILTRAWRHLETLLDQDLEANIEYSRGDANYYVRVPWQLYLIAVSARVRPYRVFSSSRLQRRFRVMLRAANGGGFFYPHSGERVSSRTNAILYDSLELIRSDVTRNTWLQAAGTVTDRFRLALGSRAIAILGSLFAFTVIVYSITQWVTERRSLADLAPELIGSFLIVLLALRKRP
jgi:hypothetical protein